MNHAQEMRKLAETHGDRLATAIFSATLERIREAAEGGEFYYQTWFYYERDEVIRRLRTLGYHVQVDHDDSITINWYCA